MAKFIVYEVEYPEEGSVLVDADSPEQARGNWLRMTHTPEKDAPELSVKAATADQIAVHEKEEA